MNIENREWVIYVLVDPRDSKVRYVGFTVNAKARLRDHCKDSELKRDYYRCRWIKSLKALGLKPVMVIIQHGRGKGWQEAEQKWIAHYRDEGAQLTNRTDGGEGSIGRKHSESAKQKMRDKRKGTKPSSLCLVKAIEAVKGKKRPKSWCEKLSERTKGIQKSEEHKQKLRIASTGKKASEETRKKMSDAHKRKGLEGKK